jgi:hypothetical protein
VERVEYQEPHPDWTEVVMLWEDILDGPKYPIRDILNWVDFVLGNRYHLHGYQSVKGFAFRFEDPTDATYFQLRWM